jgi:hypothetical protein
VVTVSGILQSRHRPDVKLAAGDDQVVAVTAAGIDDAVGQVDRHQVGKPEIRAKLGVFINILPGRHGERVRFMLAFINRCQEKLA